MRKENRRHAVMRFRVFMPVGSATEFGSKNLFLDLLPYWTRSLLSQTKECDYD
jgi:hypothetical protein